jgi:hypothetical protein
MMRCSLLAADGNSARKTELLDILKPLQKPGVSTENNQEPPGWYEQTNRMALKRFIEKYPDTEEARQAGVWLVFSQALTEKNKNPSDEKRRRSERAQKLTVIILKTASPGTAKMAKIQRAVEVFDAEDYTEFEKQTDEIINHIKDYKTETDKQYLQYLELTGMSPSDVEPTFRQMLVMRECYENHFDRALALAEELKKRFPTWDSQSVNGAIEMLKLGKTPYPR